MTRYDGPGRSALDLWFSTPVADTGRPRNELAVKLLMAASTPGVDVTSVVQRQRTASVRLMRDYNTLRRAADEVDDVAGVLLLDSLAVAGTGERGHRPVDHGEHSGPVGGRFVARMPSSQGWRRYIAHSARASSSRWSRGSGGSARPGRRSVRTRPAIAASRSPRPRTCPPSTAACRRPARTSTIPDVDLAAAPRLYFGANEA